MSSRIRITRALANPKRGKKKRKIARRRKTKRAARRQSAHRFLLQAITKSPGRFYYWTGALWSQDRAKAVRFPSPPSVMPKGAKAALPDGWFAVNVVAA